MTHLPPPLDYVLVKDGLSRRHEVIQEEGKRLNCLWETLDHQNQRMDGGRGALENDSCQGLGGEPSASDQGKNIKERAVLAQNATFQATNSSDWCGLMCDDDGQWLYTIELSFLYSRLPCLYPPVPFSFTTCLF